MNVGTSTRFGPRSYLPLVRRARYLPCEVCRPMTRGAMLGVQSWRYSTACAHDSYDMHDKHSRVYDPKLVRVPDCMRADIKWKNVALSETLKQAGPMPCPDLFPHPSAVQKAQGDNPNPSPPRSPYPTGVCHAPEEQPRHRFNADLGSDPMNEYPSTRKTVPDDFGVAPRTHLGPGSRPQGNNVHYFQRQ